jgi:formylglycine-generating enzyme required for sulfatase activity
MPSFDPYHQWLGIPPGEQPPDHYRLLGVPLFESDLDVIEAAAQRQTVFLRTLQLGPQSGLAEQILNEVARARVTLLNVDQKVVYDHRLRESLPTSTGSTPPSNADGLAAEVDRLREQQQNLEQQLHREKESFQQLTARQTEEQQAIARDVEQRHRDIEQRQADLDDQRLALQERQEKEASRWRNLAGQLEKERGDLQARREQQEKIRQDLAEQEQQLEQETRRLEQERQEVASAQRDAVKTQSKSQEIATDQGRQGVEATRQVALEAQLKSHASAVEQQRAKLEKQFQYLLREVASLKKEQDQQRSLLNDQREAGASTSPSSGVSPVKSILVTWSLVKLRNKLLVVAIGALGILAIFLVLLTKRSNGPDIGDVAQTPTEQPSDIESDTDTTSGQPQLPPTTSPKANIRNPKKPAVDTNTTPFTYSVDDSTDNKPVPPRAARDTNPTDGSRAGLNLLVARPLTSADQASAVVNVPSQAELQPARAAVGGMFNAEIESATTIPDSESVIQHIVNTVADTKQANEQFALYERALGLAAELGNIAQIEKLIGAVAEKFSIDYSASFDRCAARFEVITDDEQRNNARTSLVHTLRQQSFHYENLNRYQLALDLLQVASAQAKQLPSTAPLDRSITADKWRSAQLARDLQQHAKMLAAKEVIASDTDNAIANQVVGWFYVTVKADWKTGLPFLSKSADKQIAETAAQDAANPSGIKSCGQLATSWWKQAKSSTDPLAASVFYNRAIFWFESVIRAKVESLQAAQQKQSAQEQIVALQKQWQKRAAAAATLSVESSSGQFIIIPPRRHSDAKLTVLIPFYMGVCEVTQAQYQQLMGNDPSKSKGATKPVQSVSWNDAVEFCRQLSDEEGVEYRLPTEAEWEYACRAGTTTAYSFGDDESQLRKHAWFKGNSDGTTHSVGDKLPNGWGLYDMHGNVREWCQDARGSSRVLRGGAFNLRPLYVRAANRNVVQPDNRDHDIGFRLARTYPLSP